MWARCVGLCLLLISLYFARRYLSSRCKCFWILRKVIIWRNYWLCVNYIYLDVFRISVFCATFFIYPYSRCIWMVADVGYLPIGIFLAHSSHRLHESMLSAPNDFTA